MNTLSHKTFENYIHNTTKLELHSKKKDIYDKLPENINNIPHLILYGNEGIGKYTQALKIISKYSNYNNLKYEKKMTLLYNKEEYIFPISDIHFEVDMSLLGCNSKLLWYEITNQINEVVEIRKNRTAFIICKNFQNIHHELLDIFYSYMASNILSKVNIKYILLTNAVSFIPYSILNSSLIISYEVPSKSSLQKIKKHSFDISNNINLKSLENNINEPQFEIKISKYIANLILNNDSNFSHIRETIYEILTCNLNIHSCLYEINKIIFKHISEDKKKNILNNSFTFLKHFNNNYRPIYHLENYFYYLLSVVHEY
jgi:DNA polymerase III delta prime subunit